MGIYPIFHPIRFYMKKQVLLISYGLLGLLASCKSNKDPEPLTRTQLLTGKKWQLRSLVFSYPGIPDVNSYAQMRPCSYDDYRQFNLPNTTTYDEGPSKCSTFDPQTQLGLWALSNNDSQLTITDSNTSDTYTILELTETSLKMKVAVPQSTGTDGTSTFTYAVIK